MSAGLKRYVGTIWGLALVAVLVSLPSVVASPPEPWKILLVLVLCALADLPLLETRFGHNIEAFTFAELFLMACLMLVPAPTLVVLAAAAILAFHLMSRIELVKAAFNASSFVLGIALAGLVASLLSAGPADGIDLADAPGLVAGAMVFHLWNALAVSGAVARAQGVGTLSFFAKGAATRTLIGASNIVVGLLVVVAGSMDSRSMLLTPPVLLTLYMLYRAYLRAMQERDVWRQLEAATRELNLLDEAEVAAAALRRARQLFRADTVELALVRPGGGSRTYLVDADDGVRVEDSDSPATTGRSMTYQVMDDDDGDHGVMTCLVSPLDGPRGRLGVLRLVFGGPVKLSRREQQVLSTYSHSISTTILNVALYEDVRADAARKAHEASHDHLTGLANRWLLSTRKREAVAAADGTTALLLLDLDHFKEINDTLGHAAGDVLLQEVARRLRDFAPEGQLVARLGGDEFAVLLTGLPSPEAAEPVAEALLGLLQAPVEFEGLRLSIEGSLGVACHPQDAETSDELFRRADVAMYQAKSTRGQWLRYSADRDDSSVHRQALVAELRTAIELDQLVVHYQPQVDLETGLVVGAEALCRWEHPTRGLLLPADFISVAEQSGLVRPFTLRVLDQAVRECVRWQAIGRPVSVAVNLSARSLLDRLLPDDVAAVLARHNLPPDRLVLEITETTATSELEVVEDVLSRLRRLGVEVSVDDFGTGYSSLAFLQRTAVHELKVDRMFVAGMLHSENDLALVRATVQLARSLGARSVAEGVEDGAQAAALREMGCDVAQGYWLSKPLPAGGVRRLLELRLMERAVGVPAPRDAEVHTLRTMLA
jgi:diguanylate cyclase (GGDEF)-like protein